MPGMDSCLFFKSSLYWLFFKLALTKGSCNVSFGQIAPALQLGVELILTQPWKKPLLTFAFDAKWYILIYRHVGHKKRLPGNGWLMALRKSKQANSLWFCMGGKSKYVFSERISAYWWVTCSMRRGGERSLGSLRHVFQKNKTSTTRARKEGEGVHALPRGNVITMSGSQLTASGWARASLPLSFGLPQCHAPSYTMRKGEGYF